MTQQPFFYCEKCGAVFEDQTHVETRAQSGEVRGEPITVEMPLRVCNGCGAELSDTLLDDASLIATYDVYRARHNLIFPAQIVALREKYGLSQKNLALLLGLGEVTVHRYEGGALAEEAPSKLLRLMEDPANMERMLAESGAKLPAPALAKVRARLGATDGKRPRRPSPSHAQKREPRPPTPPNAMGDIYARLEKAGLKSGAVRALLLPGWFEDEMARNDATRLEIEVALARDLSLELTSLRTPGAALVLRDTPGAALKSRANAPDEKQHFARALGARLGQLVAAACAGEQSWQGHSAASIRAEILAGGASSVGLRELLDWSWRHGLPVVSATLPEGLRSCDGMALMPSQRAVALSFCSRPQGAWQAFIVAHEIGHHVLGHLGDKPEIFDEAIESGDDDDEKAANQFAISVLTGGAMQHAEAFFGDAQCWPKTPELAAKIEEFADRHHVAPAVVALQLFNGELQKRKAGQPERVALCMKTAQLLDSCSCAPIFAGFYSRLATGVWKDDEFEFFGKLTGATLD